jgi:hypothetical protein
MPTTLRGSIEDLFSRKQDKDFVLELVLTSFQRRQNLKFPQSWNIKSEHWDEIEGKDESEEDKCIDWGAIDEALGEIEREMEVRKNLNLHRNGHLKRKSCQAKTSNKSSTTRYSVSLTHFLDVK